MGKSDAFDLVIYGVIYGGLALGIYAFTLYPTEPRIERVRFTSHVFRSLLALLMILFMLDDLRALMLILLVYDQGLPITFHEIQSLIPAVFDGAILFMVFKCHKYVRVFVKAWCILQVISAGFGLLSQYYTDEIDTAFLIVNCFNLAMGMAIYLLSNRYIQVDYANAEK